MESRTSLLAAVRATAIAALSALVVLTTPAQAHAQDVYLFNPNTFSFYNGISAAGANTVTFGPFTINGVTAHNVPCSILTSGCASCIPIPCSAWVGAGSCLGTLGQACLQVPSLNPNTGVPFVRFDCEINGFNVGMWPSAPALFIAQDSDANTAIVNFPIGFEPVLLPIGQGSPPSVNGAFPAGGSSFGFAPFNDALPLHLIAAHPLSPPGTADPFLTMTVTCYAD